MTENSYAATATAEKRLREVLTERFDGEHPAFVERIAEALLADAEIEYLPRKKSVSIRLMVPETASSKVMVPETASSKVMKKGGVNDSVTATDGEVIEDPADVGIGYAEHVQMTDLPHDRGAAVAPFTPRPEAVDYEDDFFTE